MLSLRRSPASQQVCDVSAAVARVVRTSSAGGIVDKASDSANACADAIVTLENALDTLREASRMVREAANHVIDAAEADDAERALLAERYDDSRRRIDDLTDDGAGGTVTLLKSGAAPISVPLRGAVYAISPFPLSTGEYGLDLPPPVQGFVSHAEVSDTLRRIEIAMERISRAKAIYRQDIAFLRTRIPSSRPS